MSSEKRVWKVEKEDLLEESAHLRSQVRFCDYFNITFNFSVLFRNKPEVTRSYYGFD